MAVLSERVLNRATLQRQLLLERSDREPLAVVELLVGMQGQDPELPYIGLWNRIAGFSLDDLTSLIERGRVVRGTMYRCTQHVLSGRDYLWIRPLLQPMLARMRRSFFGRVTVGVDHDELAAEACRLLEKGPMTRPELGRALRRRWPEHEGVWLARTAQVALPILHPYPDGIWGRRGPTPFALAEEVLGRPFDRTRSLADLVLRYLAAFGPAGVMDMQAWSGLTRLREVVEPLRPQLVTYRSPSGAELFDLPDRPLPDPDIPAPVRFLAGFDNVTFGYADRSRIIADAYRPALVANAGLTVDGTVRGVWRHYAGTLTVTLFESLTDDQQAAVQAEAKALLTLIGGETVEIRLGSPAA
ncbi:MAG TPA: winged helix DNA-binding domain-containing protein [Actinoplanes sp.]|nr:winged helix DNA-binding domain-containing protein [Actinoplanes sp.]